VAYTLSERAPGASDLTAKNRVWENFSSTRKSRPANRRQPQQPRRKIRPAATKPASGIPLWPSRDPIGEQGGNNLYAFAGNDGVNRWDYLGLWKNAKDCDEKQIAALKAAETASRAAFGKWQNFMDIGNLDDDKLFSLFPWLDKKNANYRNLARFNEGYRKNLEVLVKYFDDNKYNVECECSCDEDDIAYTYWPWGDTIHFCPSYFSSGATEQAATFGHEMSHLSLSTGDSYDWTTPSKDLSDSLDRAQLYEDAVRFGNNVEFRYKQWVENK